MDSTALKEILDSLTLAIKNAIANGGVTQYSLNTGQSQTKVVQATLPELHKMHKDYTAMYNEAIGIETGSNTDIIRDVQCYHY